MHERRAEKEARRPPTAAQEGRASGRGRRGEELRPLPLAARRAKIWRLHRQMQLSWAVRWDFDQSEEERGVAVRGRRGRRRKRRRLNGSRRLAPITAVGGGRSVCECHGVSAMPLRPLSDALEGLGGSEAGSGPLCQWRRADERAGDVRTTNSNGEARVTGSEDSTDRKTAIDESAQERQVRSRKRQHSGRKEGGGGECNSATWSRRRAVRIETCRASRSMGGTCGFNRSYGLCRSSKGEPAKVQHAY